ISPSGNEVGPFLPIEQAALSEVVSPKARTNVFAWYTLAGSFATAAGALGGGFIPRGVTRTATSAPENYRAVIVLYGVLGLVLAGLFAALSRAAEVKDPGAVKSRLGLGESRGIVLKLAGLFSLDAFAGGFVIQ